MGKKDNRVAFINPIAAGRSSGAVHSGPSIKDYLNRPRPSWDEVKEMIKSKRKGGSRTLEAFESNLNKNFRAELDRGREQFFNADKRKRRKRKRLRSSSSSSTSSSNDSHNDRNTKKSSRKKKKKDKNRRSRHSSEEHCSSSSGSEWEEAESINERRKKKKKRRKKKRDKD